MPIFLSERRISSVLLLIITSALLYSTFGREFAQLGGAFSPMFFPRIILLILLVLTSFNALSDFVNTNKMETVKIFPLLGVSIAIFFYVILIVPVGFFLSSVGVGIAILVCLGLRNPIQVILMPTLVAGSLIVLFNHVLKMPLPTSPFFWWL